MILFWEWIKKIIHKFFLKECKHKIKKTQMPKFIKIELKSDSDWDLDSDLEKMETKIDNKLEPGFDSE